MKKLLFLIPLFICSIAFGQVNKTIDNGGSVTITTTNTAEAIYFQRRGVIGCNVVTVEIVSCNAAGVAISSGLPQPTVWANVQRLAASKVTTFTFCFSSDNPYQKAVPILIYGTSGDVITFRY